MTDLSLPDFITMAEITRNSRLEVDAARCKRFTMKRRETSPFDGYEFRDMTRPREEMKRLMAMPHIEPADLNVLWVELFGAVYPAEKPSGPGFVVNYG